MYILHRISISHPPTYLRLKTLRRHYSFRNMQDTRVFPQSVSRAISLSWLFCPLGSEKRKGGQRGTCGPWLSFPSCSSLAPHRRPVPGMRALREKRGEGTPRVIKFNSWLQRLVALLALLTLHASSFSSAAQQVARIL